MKKAHFIALLTLCTFCTAIGTAQQKQDTTQYNAANIKLIEIEEVIEPAPFIPAEIPPAFMGSTDLSEFRKWIYQCIYYPVIAQENGIQGRVKVLFTIDCNGVVDNVNILRGVDFVLDREVVRVIKSSPKWQPAKQNGKPVPYTTVISVVFKLQ